MSYQFQIKSGKVNLTDPCYDTSTFCGMYNVPAKNGTWVAELSVLTNAQTFGWGNRVESFEVWHEDVNKHNLNIVPMYADFGVDSGQFGVFDSSTYVGDPRSDKERTWYFMVCDLTIGDDMCGVTEDGTGFASRTGYGDGGYEGEGAYVNGELVYFKIVFIADSDEDDEDDEEDSSIFYGTI